MSQKIYFQDNQKCYEISISRRDANGKRLRKKAKFDHKGKRIISKQVADRIEYQLRKEVEKLWQQSSTLTWENWHNDCLRRMRLTLLESTVTCYDGCLKKWLPLKWRQKNLTEITRNDVFELIFEHVPSKKPVTKHLQQTVLRRVRRIFAMAVEDDILGKNPTIGISIKIPPAKKKVINSNEANTLLRAAKDCNHRFYYHWALALFTGMRNGELYALRWPDIDFETGLISVTKQWTSKDGLHSTKSNSNRVVPISKELKKLLVELKTKGAFRERLFAGMNSAKKYPPTHPERQTLEFGDFVLPRLREWRHGIQSKILSSFCQQLGIEEVKFHDLRATFITNMLAQGVPLVKVMAIVGHSEMSTTNEYLRLSGVDIKKDTTDRLGYHLHNVPESNIVNLF